MGFASVKKIAEADFPTRWGAFRILGFEGVLTAPRPGGEADATPERNGDGSASNGASYEIKSGEVEGLVALVMGDVHSAPPLVRIHSQCLTGDVFGSLRCDCRLQLEQAMRQIAAEGAGILLYEQQEGRGIGLMAKLRAYELQDQGMDTVEANVELGFAADCRAYELPAEVLKLMGVKAVRLITNNPEKVAALETAGIAVVERVSAEVEPQESFADYVRTKQEKMGHIADAVVGEDQSE
jgi:GTP cyclohydrolase II